MDHMIGCVLLHHELTREARARKACEWALDAPEIQAQPGLLARLLKSLRRREASRDAACPDLSLSSARHCR